MQNEVDFCPDPERGAEVNRGGRSMERILEMDLPSELLPDGRVGRGRGWRFHDQWRSALVTTHRTTSRPSVTSKLEQHQDMRDERLPTEQGPRSEGPAKPDPGASLLGPSKELYFLGQLYGFFHKGQANHIGAVCGVPDGQDESSVNCRQPGLAGGLDIPKPLCLGEEGVRQG